MNATQRLQQQLNALSGDGTKKRKTAPDGYNQSHKVTIEQTIEKKEDEWRPITFKAAKRCKANCFGCEYGMTNPDESEPALKGMWQLFTDNFGKQMSNENLAEMIHTFFEREIRKPMRAQGQACPPWTVEMILEHIEVHILEPTVTCANQIRNLKSIEQMLYDRIKLKDPHSEEYKVDYKALKGILDVQKQIQALYNSKNTRQLFYSDTLKLDERRANQKD
jgi:hypothetical protein